jgi:hypothetical protein
LDGGAVFDARHDEGSADGGAGSFAAGADVVVAEVAAAERGRAAAVSVGEDVAAEVAAFGIDLRVGGVAGDGLEVVEWIWNVLFAHDGGGPLPPLGYFFA